MIKTINIFVIISVIMAQNNFNIIGGVTLSKIDISGEETPNEVNNAIGFKFGIEQILSNGFTVGTTFSQRGYAMKMSSNSYSFEGDFSINYLTAYLVKSYNLDNDISISFGGEGGFFVNAKTKATSCIYEECVTVSESVDRDDSNISDFDIGLLIGAKYRISPQISLAGNYYYGLSNANDSPSIEISHRSFQIYLSYKI